MYSTIYYLYRYHRIDETLFVLETKQNYYQAQAIENEEEWVFFNLSDYDKVPGQVERYFRVCPAYRHRLKMTENHWSYQREV